MQHEQYQLHADVECRHWWFVARRRIIRAMVNEILPPAPDSMILDVGCGTGGNIASLASHYQCIGIDTSEDAIALAKKCYSDVKFVCGFPEQELQEVLPQVRLVMLNDVLEHVEDDFQLLSNLFAHTSPGTYFLLTVPADMELWSEHDESFGHYRRYDIKRFQRIWRDLPAVELMTSHFNSRLYSIIRHLRRRNRKRGHASGNHGTDLSIPPYPLNKLMEVTFAGEQKKLLAQLRGDTAKSYSSGVSLMTILHRTEATEHISVITKPKDVAADYYQPVLVGY